MKKLSPNEFIYKYKCFALQTEEKTGIPLEFTLAQAAIESGWGEKAIGNMFFGVKANTATPMNKKQLLVTREVLKTNLAHFPEIISIRTLPDGRFEYKVKDWFRKYDTPEESFTDHADFFFTNPRYSKAIEEVRVVQNLKKAFEIIPNVFLEAKKQSKKIYRDARVRLPYDFADEISTAGYATDPNYAKSLKKVIDTIKNNL